MAKRGLLSDSGYHGDAPSPVFQCYVPSRALSVGTHEVQNGRITSNFNVTPEQAEEQDRRRKSNCCRRCCGRVGSFCCITKTSPACKLLVVAFWLIFFPLLLALNFRFAILHDKYDVMFSAGDQGCVTEKLLSATFCESVEMYSEQHFSAHKLAKEPTLKDTVVRPYYISYKPALIEGEDYSEDHYKILRGTTMDVVLEIDRGVIEFYIVAGEKNWAEWQSNPHCKSCTYYYHPLGLRNNNECIFEPCTLHIELSDADSEIYHIVLYNPLRQSSSPVRAKMEIYMNRTIYDAISLYNCTSVTSCNIPMDIFTQQAVMVEYLAYDNSGNYSDIYVDVYCVPRLYIYFVIFAGIPIFIWIIALIIVCNCKRNVEEHRRILVGEAESEDEDDDEGNHGENESSLSLDERSPIAMGASPIGTSDEFDKMEIPAELINHIWFQTFNTLTPRQNGRHFLDGILKWIFLNKVYESRLKFHRCLFLGAQLTIFQHWFR